MSRLARRQMSFKDLLKTLKKEIKEDGKTSHVPGVTEYWGSQEGGYTTKINFSIKTLMSHFTDLEKTTTQEFIWNHKRP